MTDDQVRALLIVAALLSGASGSAGFVGGRMSVPVPPAEVRYVPVPVPLASAAPAEAPPIEPPVAAAPNEIEPAASAPAARVEAAPLPMPRPKVEAKPSQPKPEKPAAKRPRPRAPANAGLPSCAVIKREYEAMTWPQRMAAYRRATPQEIAQGKRCLGF